MYIVATIYYIDKKIWVPEQYGFQKNISTAHAILYIVMAFYDNIYNNDYSNLILLDLKKAFDSVSHEILLKELDHYGIRGPSHALIKSFLYRQ